MRMKLALGIYLVAGAVDIGLGTTYFSSKQFMSYHAEAVGASWQELDVGLQTLILALMKLAGGGWFALGFFTIVLALAAPKNVSLSQDGRCRRGRSSPIRRVLQQPGECTRQQVRQRPGDRL